MKTFLGILAGAVLAFLAGAMSQEWEVFAQPWFEAPDVKASLSESDRKAAADTLFLFLKLSSHLYGTSGDARFAERIPASPAIVEEIVSEIEYLDHVGLVEDPVLQRMEIISVHSTDPSRAEIVTREFWITRRFRRGGSVPLDTRSDIIFTRYRLIRSEEWQVVSWDPTEPPKEAEPS